MECRTIVLPSVFYISERFVAQLTGLASSFQSRVYIQQAERKVNAKSMMGLMSMSFAPGTQFDLTADGEDERAAIAALTKFFYEER